MSKSAQKLSKSFKNTQKITFISVSFEKTNPISVLPPGAPRLRRKSINLVDRKISEDDICSLGGLRELCGLYNHEKTNPIAERQNKCNAIIIRELQNIHRFWRTEKQSQSKPIHSTPPLRGELRASLAPGRVIQTPTASIQTVASTP